MSDKPLRRPNRTKPKCTCTYTESDSTRWHSYDCPAHNLSSDQPQPCVACGGKGCSFCHSNLPTTPAPKTAEEWYEWFRKNRDGKPTVDGYRAVMDEAFAEGQRQAMENQAGMLGRVNAYRQGFAQGQRLGEMHAKDQHLAALANEFERGQRQERERWQQFMKFLSTSGPADGVVINPPESYA